MRLLEVIIKAITVIEQTFNTTTDRRRTLYFRLGSSAVNDICCVYLEGVATLTLVSSFNGDIEICVHMKSATVEPQYLVVHD